MDNAKLLLCIQAMDNENILEFDDAIRLVKVFGEGGKFESQFISCVRQVGLDNQLAITDLLDTLGLDRGTAFVKMLRRKAGIVEDFILTPEEVERAKAAQQALDEIQSKLRDYAEENPKRQARAAELYAKEAERMQTIAAAHRASFAEVLYANDIDVEALLGEGFSDLSHEEKTAVGKTKIEELIASRARPVWQPIVEDGETDQPISKYHGDAWLMEGEEWPLTPSGFAAQMILQLEVKSLPETISALFNNEGMIQFFYDQSDFEDNSVVRWVDNTLPGRNRNHMTDVDEDKLVLDEPIPYQPKIITGWEVGIDYPHYEDNPEVEAIAEECDIDIDDNGRNPLQGDKLGGWPSWTQGSETPLDSKGEPMIMFYQIDAGCFFYGASFPAHAPELFAGDGTGHLFVSKTDRTEMAFHWACG